MKKTKIILAAGMLLAPSLLKVLPFGKVALDSFGDLGWDSSCFSQNIAINTTGAAANASALLDVDATNKGLLIPRVALTSTTDAVTIATPATSLLVYNNGTGGLSPAGYYYNSGTPASPNWASFTTSISGGGNCFINWQLFTVGGTFTVPAGVTKIKVVVWGGGGGGGGGRPGNCGGNQSAGGGGGGGYAEGIYAVAPATPFAVTIGAGGAGGGSCVNGSAGGISSFGALISATGGSGGGGSSAVLGFGGQTGLGSGGYHNSTLGPGGAGAYQDPSANSFSAQNGGGGGGAGGSGGGSGGGGGGGYGGGNGGDASNNNSVNALANTGAGGGGAGAGAGGVGGNGAMGKVIVFW